MNDDAVFRQQKEEIASRVLRNELIGTGSSILTAGGVALAFLVGGPAAIAGGAIIGVGGLALGYKAYRNQISVDMDLKDIEAQRTALRMAQSFGPQQQMVVQAAQAPGRSDGRHWVDVAAGPASSPLAR